jgi:hypothetical protein
MPAVDEIAGRPSPSAKCRNVGRATALEIVVVLPPLSRFGGKATTTLRRGPLSNHVSPFRNECFGGDACGGRLSRVVPYARS